MKLQRLFYSLVFFSLAMAPMACSDDEPGEKMPDVKVEDPFQEVATEDLMKVTSNLKSYVFTDTYTEISNRLIARLKNVTGALTADVETVVMHNNKLASLTDEELEILLRIYLHNGNIVLVEPEIPEWNQFICRLVDAVERLSANECPKDLEARLCAINRAVFDYKTRNDVAKNETIYVDNNLEGSLDEHFYDIIALRDNDVYYVDDIHNVDDLKEIPTQVISEDEETDEISESEITTKLDIKLTAYDYGLQADLVCAWLNDKVNHEATKQALWAKGRELLAETRSSSNLKDLMTAQRQRFQYRAYSPCFTWRSAPFEVIFDVWTANDLTKHEDFYLVHQEISARNQDLNCGPTESDHFWYYTGDKANQMFGFSKFYAYGPYMKGLRSESWLTGNNSHSVWTRDSRPSTTSGSSSVTSGFSWNLGGEVGLGTSGINGAVSGGVTYSESYTSNIPDLSVSQTRKDNNQKWSYDAPRPGFHSPAFKNRYHDTAKAIQTNTCTVNNTWIWVVPNPSGQYTLNCNTALGVEMTGYHHKLSGLKIVVSNFTNFVDNKSTMLLTPPSRKVFNCKMKCVAVEEGAGAQELQQFLQNNYSNIGWMTDLKLFATELNSQVESLAQTYLDRVVGMMRNDAQLWKSEGKAGKYDVYITDGQNHRVATQTLEFK